MVIVGKMSGNAVVDPNMVCHQRPMTRERSARVHV
jgi:hypothetical protein